MCRCRVGTSFGSTNAKGDTPDGTGATDLDVYGKYLFGADQTTQFAAGALATFVKGLDYEEALLALAAVATLAVFRNAFDRDGRLAPSTEYVVSTGLFAVILFVAVGLGSYGAFPAVDEIFGKFEALGHGVRFGRGLVLLASAVGFIALPVRPACARLRRPPGRGRGRGRDRAVARARPQCERPARRHRRQGAVPRRRDRRIHRLPHRRARSAGAESVRDVRSEPARLVTLVERADRPPLASAIARTGSLPVLCVDGAGDETSGCHGLPSATLVHVEIPGGHHFGGNFGKVADAVAQFVAATGAALRR